jgi:hypothetical protein
VFSVRRCVEVISGCQVILAEVDLAFGHEDFFSRAAERAESHQLEVWTLDQFAFKRKDFNGFLLGFAPFTERELRAAVGTLSRVLVHQLVCIRLLGICFRL